MNSFPMPSEEDGDVMTVEEFIASVKSTLFTNDDGTGYYAMPTWYARDARVDCAALYKGAPPLGGYTHVVWFNK